VLSRLAASGVQLNVTAVMTLDQVQRAAAAVARSRSSFISLFAGRVADTGRDPLPLMSAAVNILSSYPHLELIWASPRELLNIYHAEAVGCHIITVTNDILKKISLIGKNLDEYSLETVRMFYEDGRKAAFQLARAKTASL
jgi:transaldolase